MRPTIKTEPFEFWPRPYDGRVTLRLYENGKEIATAYVAARRKEAIIEDWMKSRPIGRYYELGITPEET